MELTAQAGGVRAAGLESVDFLEQGFEVDDDTVADDRGDVLGEDTGRQQLEFVLFTADDDGVAGVVAAVGLDDVVDVAAEDVGRLTFAFVAPLGTDDDDCGHILVLFFTESAGVVHRAAYAVGLSGQWWHRGNVGTK